MHCSLLKCIFSKMHFSLRTCIFRCIFCFCRRFYEIDWTVAAHAGLAPPFIPSVEPWETTMFDKYSESTESSAHNPRDAEQVLFDGF